MALGTLPPWLDVTPEMFVGAAKAGASLGLQRREQDIQQREAADRLRLAYDSLASQERRESEAEAAKLRITEAAQQMRAQQMDALNRYRQDALQQRQQQLDAVNQYREDALGLRESRGEALDQYRGQMIGERDKALTQREEAATKLDNYRQQLSDARQAAMEFRQKQSEDRLTPLQKHDLTVKAHGLDSAQKALSAAIATQDGDSISLARKSLNAAKKEYDDFRTSLDKSQSQPSTPRRTSVKSPHPDGTVLRHKDGSRWIVKDGVPVPLNDNQASADDESSEE